ncbi:MAG: glycosyltransferase family 4 protein, partial [Phycisphaerae bacterium]
ALLNCSRFEEGDPTKPLSPHRVPILRRVVRNLMVRADRVVAQSSNTASNARNFYQVTRPIDVIPLGIVPPELPSPSRDALGIDDDRFVMVTVGRLVARKGLEDQLKVLAALNDPRDLLVIIGDGPKRSEWEALAGTLGIADRVRFCGRVSEADKWAYLTAADLYVSTSLHEGFGLVFLEAMHAGLPVVTYDYGGQTDFLLDGKTGALVPVGRRREFVTAVQRLKASPDLRRTCAAFNRERIRDYHIDRCAARYESLFEEVVERADRSMSSGVAGPTARHEPIENEVPVAVR